MKLKSLLLFVFCFSSTFTYSQKAKVKAAYNYYKEPYQQYDKAKAEIDEAFKDAQTKTMDMAWYYRGLIYSALFKNEKFGSLCFKCLETAYESFHKSLEINPKNEWADEINVIRIPWLMNQVFSQGVDQFKAKNYADALSSFESVLGMSPGDTSVILNAAYSAELAGDHGKAINYYSRLTSMHYKDDKIYLALSNLYKQDRDTSHALSILKAGRVIFPDSLSLMLAQINIFLAGGHHKEAIEALDAAIKKDPNNQSLYLALGSTYDNLANSYSYNTDNNNNSLQIEMVSVGGNYMIPVKINGLKEIDFTFDTGASETTVTADVVMTMIRQKIISNDDFLPGQVYVLADGSKVTSPRFKIKQLQIGEYEINNIEAVITSSNASPLLGQNVLREFKSVKQDNNSNKIILELNDNNFSNSAKANEHLNKVEQTEHLSKAEQTEYLNKAEQTYKQGLTINPNNFEINFNLGALYFNQAAEMANAANNIKSNDEFEKAKQKYNQKFKASEPYLEKALEISPADKSTLSSLKQLYVRTGETEKYNRVKATLENIK